MEEEEGDLINRTILGEASQRSIEEIVEETQPNKERSGKIPSQAEDPKDNPSMLSRHNLHQEGEEDSLPGKEWIKIGNEYFKNPVPTTTPPNLQIIKEFATDSLFQSGQNDKRCKRNFEEDANTGFVPGSLTEFPNNGFTKYHGLNVEEKYVKLSVVNELFMSTTKTEEVEGEKEKKNEEDLASCFSFRTKRRYLYY
ncbi:hypothetical protein PRUPE_1G094100 [Prunus persica]|uniref:Uncharacterized protein n=1 Tax=Prunus persica TaxID=3760 RepID=M5XGU0_PRUPE|nr:hypothetical protein PRUPE_1G094100 [Prunus persica]